MSHRGRNDVTSHEKTDHHKEMEKEAKSLSSFFRPQTQQSVIKAETLWSVFTVKHNLAFLTSDHATACMIFKEMFTDSEIAKKNSCSHTKTTDIVKNALAWMNLMTKLTSHALFL